MGLYFLKKKYSYEYLVVQLIPDIKSAYQIRSYVKMDIKRGMYLVCNFMNNNFI